MIGTKGGMVRGSRPGQGDSRRERDPLDIAYPVHESAADEAAAALERWLAARTGLDKLVIPSFEVLSRGIDFADVERLRAEESIAWADFARLRFFRDRAGGDDA